MTNPYFYNSEASFSAPLKGFQFHIWMNGNIRFISRRSWTIVYYFYAIQYSPILLPSPILSLSLSAKKLLTGRWQARPLLGRKRMSGEKCIGRAKDLIIPTCTPPFAPSFLFSIFSFYTNDTAFVPLQSHARKATWCSSFLSFKFLAKEEFPC